MRHADIAPHTHSLPRLGFRKLACFSDAGFAASALSWRREASRMCLGIWSEIEELERQAKAE